MNEKSPIVIIFTSNVWTINSLSYIVIKFKQIHFTTSYKVKIGAWWVANSVDPDQMLHDAASDLGLHWFTQASLSEYFGLIW